MNCDFCNKTFSSKSNLLTHQKTAKYCLDLQGKQNNDFICKDCNRSFTANKILVDHVQICKERLRKEKEEKEQDYTKTIRKLETELGKLKKDKTYDKYEKQLEEKVKELLRYTQENDYIKKTLQEKEEYIAKLEAKLEKMEEKLDCVFTMAIESKTLAQATTTNNTTTNITVTNNNFLNLSKEHVNKVLTEHLDYNVVYAGQAGFAKFIVDKILKGPDGKLTYKCVDPSRQMFEFIDESGETIRDMRAEKLIQSLLDGDALKIGLDAAAKGWNTDDRQLNNERTATFGPRVTEYTELNRNNTVFRTKVSSLTT
jgi:hypothetical protein